MDLYSLNLLQVHETVAPLFPRLLFMVGGTMGAPGSLKLYQVHETSKHWALPLFRQVTTL